MSTLPTSIAADSPELRVLAQMAGIDPIKVGLAFSQPELLFEHISLGELSKLNICCNRLARMGVEMARALDIYAEVARKILEETS